MSQNPFATTRPTELENQMLEVSDLEEEMDLTETDNEKTPHIKNSSHSVSIAEIKLAFTFNINVTIDITLDSRD